METQTAKQKQNTLKAREILRKEEALRGWASARKTVYKRYKVQCDSHMKTNRGNSAASTRDFFWDSCVG